MSYCGTIILPLTSVICERCCYGGYCSFECKGIEKDEYELWKTSMATDSKSSLNGCDNVP